MAQLPTPSEPFTISLNQGANGPLRHLARQCVAQQVDHGRRFSEDRIPHRLAHDATDMLRKLVRADGPYGPMAGVVNARRNFINDQSSLSDEKLHRQDPHVVHCVH